MSRRYAVVLAALSALLWSAGAAFGVGTAQAQIKPRIMIALDSSGSMGESLNDLFTYGDGVGDTACAQGLDTDCDGLANDSRMFRAKEAVRNMIQAYGDVDWALARFHQVQQANITCYDVNNVECALGAPTSYGNPQCNTGPNYSNMNCAAAARNDRDAIPIACRPGQGANAQLKRRANADPFYCLDYSGNCPGMADPVGDVLVGFQGLGAFTNTPNENAILKWIDNKQTNPFLNAITDGNFCNHATNGDCELRAQGLTPLGGVLQAMGDYLGDVKAGDDDADCRPYSVILITDGTETCGGNPSAAAAAIYALGVPTYVVGLSISNSGKTQLNAIATAGHTDAGAAGGDTAYFANDPDTLAVGLGEIVRKSLLFETCDGDDNDCDDNVDEGFTKYCNKPGSHNAQDLCADPGETLCNGVDDNCNGMTDEGLLNLCGTCGTAPAEICDGIDNDCDGVVDENNVCNCASSGEICDNLDNDCDNKIDENLSRSCGSNVGECTIGAEICTKGVWGSCSGANPHNETCDGKDNNCDGVVDLITRTCGQTGGTCALGTQLCTNKVWGACVGNVSPVTEVCDGLDNDCDSKVDEGNPGGGGNCGIGSCTAGMYQCVSGSLSCVGTISGGAELCNGEDDDCDGSTDEGLGVGGPCGSSIGDCEPGMVVCVDGMPECVGEDPGSSETCDNEDNDCDNAVDEDVATGGVCGEEEGICMPGSLSCVNGAEVCTGAVPPGRETCDCSDNDCDGEIDEKPDTGALCPSGSKCVECQCAVPCLEVEFSANCPSGKAASRQEDGTCYCVADLCDDNECGKKTIKAGDDTRCAPDSDDLSGCVCKNNACTYPCEGVVCPTGLICNPRDPEGRCEEDSCRGLGCGDGQICNGVTGECEADPCLDVECGDKACRAGKCETSCADISCEKGDKCQSGKCVEDKCAGVKCMFGQLCNPDIGECVANVCQSIRCPSEAICDITVGACAVDPCTLLHCPTGEVCKEGECANPDTTPGGEVDAGTPKHAPGKRVLASGGGGFTCTVSRTGGSGEGGVPFLALLLGVGVIVARRGRRRWAVSGVFSSAKKAVATGAFLASFVLAAMVLTGCNVDPFCIDCGKKDAGDYDSGKYRSDGMVPLYEGGLPPDAGTDSGPPPGTEVCNGKDDDNDAKVDEDFDFDTSLDHCGSCNAACAPDHAFALCDTGECKLTACDVGWHDINGNLADGCEYRCIENAEDDSICDMADNDCDGDIDEDVDFNGDANNCGQCSRKCSFQHATSACETGDCVLTTCDADYFDNDGKDSTGCEYPCHKTGETELCNLVDDNCNGTIDEGNPEGGGACGNVTGTCTAGALKCSSGALVCDGGNRPTTESCDTLDNDCDMHVDEDTAFQTDVNNCGVCGRRCTLTRATAGCSGAACYIVNCNAGYHDIDHLPANGCEYKCSYAGPEICNGKDDDCDKIIDEGVTAPANLCNQNGVCAGTTGTCSGVSGWTCNYAGNSAIYQAVETLCDTKDNDCDGTKDEGYSVNVQCSNGEKGNCLRYGTFECNGTNDGVVCNAPAVGSGIPEQCDGEDDDCDGRTDEDMDTTTVPAVNIGGIYVMKYEASRPDATVNSSGTLSNVACSKANVLPWVNVTWEEADAACCALNDTGTCTGGTGWALCDAPDWEAACESQTNACTWSYSAACSASGPTKCNGREYDCDSGTAGVQDCLKTTGNAGFAGCFADWGGAGTIYDLSGNVKEWTATQRGGAMFHEIRGGSYNNVEGGRTCEFDFTAGNLAFKFPNTGFRCCYTP